MSANVQLVKTISEVVQALIQAHKDGRTVNLSTIKSQFARRNGLTTIPKTVEVIAAIPENWKKFILPKIRAKPIRTASGVRYLSHFPFFPNYIYLNLAYLS